MVSLGLVDLPLWMLLLLVFVLLLYVYGTWTHTVWSSQRIRGPKPWPLIGNVTEIHKKSQFHVFTEWQRKYGRLVGYFVGVRPVLMVSEPNMLREILVKNFHCFNERNVISGLIPPLVNLGLFFSHGSDWKRIRSMMTPSFSTSKLKLMSHYVDRCSDLLTKSIERKARSEQIIDVKEVFASYTMDVIAGTAFGMETNSQTEVGEPFSQHCKELFAKMGFRGVLRVFLYIVYIFPFMARWVYALGLSSFNPDHVQFFCEAVEEMVNQRRQMSSSGNHGRKAVDLLQMLVEAEVDPEHITDNTDNRDKRRMTRDEIKAQGFIMLIAGYESTASTLQYLAYNLTRFPHIQQKVFEEIRDVLGDEDPTYENVSKLKYLDCVIHESMRFFPPIAQFDRKASEKIIVDGVVIPAGCGISVPIYSMMHDPEFFPDPHVFDPDRFLEENVSKMDPLLLDLPFGHGPRRCIGMRLAWLEIMFAAARIFKQFRFVKCDETPEEIHLGKSFALAIPDVTIMVKAEIRSATM